MCNVRLMTSYIKISVSKFCCCKGRKYKEFNDCGRIIEYVNSIIKHEIAIIGKKIRQNSSRVFSPCLERSYKVSRRAEKDINVIQLTIHIYPLGFPCCFLLLEVKYDAGTLFILISVGICPCSNESICLLQWLIPVFAGFLISQDSLREARTLKTTFHQPLHGSRLKRGQQKLQKFPDIF